jgi:hypothetical protein
MLYAASFKNVVHVKFSVSFPPLPLPSTHTNTNTVVRQARGRDRQSARDLNWISVVIFEIMFLWQNSKSVGMAKATIGAVQLNKRHLI